MTAHGRRRRELYCRNDRFWSPWGRVECISGLRIGVILILKRVHLALKNNFSILLLKEYFSLLQHGLVLIYI
jgi:hypothetical protein